MKYQWYTEHVVNEGLIMRNRDYIERLHETSRKLFVQKGYDNVTMDEICDQAGVSKPTAYAANLNKPALLEHLYQTDQIPDELRAANTTDILSAIDGHLDLILNEIFQYGPGLLRDILRVKLEVVHGSSFIERTWFSSLIECIEQAQQTQKIDNALAPQMLGSLVVNFMIGYCFEYSIAHAEEKRENLYSGVRTILRVRTESV